MGNCQSLFVLGYPLSHTKSPIIHNYWYKHYGIHASYKTLEIPPTKIKNFIKKIKTSEFIGGNITLPYKEKMLNLVDRVEQEAHEIRAINTLYLDKKNRLVGANTDYYGFMKNIEEQAPECRKGSAMIIGAGGASRAVIYALKKMGFLEIILVNRTLERAQNLTKEFSFKISLCPWSQCNNRLKEVDLLVNATPLGMYRTHQKTFSLFDSAALFSPLDMSYLSKDTVVADLIYNPVETPFLKLAKNFNLKIADGIGMLLHQAASGFERWFNFKPEIPLFLRQKIKH